MVCLISFRIGHIRVTIYHFSCHMVYLAKLLDLHSMEFQFMCATNPDVTPLKHWNLQVWVHLYLTRKCSHTWDHDGIFSNHEVLSIQEPSEPCMLLSTLLKRKFLFCNAQLFCVLGLHHQRTPWPNINFENLRQKMTLYIQQY